MTQFFNVPPLSIAVIYVGLGDKDHAFDWLDKAYAERSSWMSWLKVDPRLDSLRSDPRFDALVRKVGFSWGNGESLVTL